MNFGQLNTGNLNINMGTITAPIKPADTVVLPGNQVTYPSDQVGNEGNWLDELVSDTPTMIVLIVVMVVAFGVCLAVFLKLLNEKNLKKKK